MGGSTAPAPNGPDSDRPGFLIVNEFLRSLPCVRALKTAFELGVVERLASHGSGSAQALARMVGLEQRSMAFLLGLLRKAGVVTLHQGDVRITRRFRQALDYRDLLEAKLDYIGFCLVDFGDLFTPLLRGDGEFERRSRLFQMFDYQRGLGTDIQQYRHTFRWVRLTSTLTRYEVPVCLEHYPFSDHRRMLDVGGNSGEMALQVCRRHPALQATVFDLPAVCELGLSHVLPHPEHQRIAFVQGDLRRDHLPAGHDLITFKSMLHDWPTADARRFLQKAFAALPPSGTVLIFERMNLDPEDLSDDLHMVPNFLFLQYYRDSQDYVAMLRAIGFADIGCVPIALDSDYAVITARKPAA